VTSTEPDGGASRPGLVSRRVRLALLLYGVAAAVLLTDRITKVWARGSLPGRPPITLIPGVLDLSFTTNRGGAFGLFGGAAWLFFGATVVVCGVIVYASLALPGWLGAVGLGLVLGGAAGNLTDRLVNRGPLSGHVVDFIHLHGWPVFNVADSSIVVGAVILVASSVLRGRSR
jgi:signal peptidase II